LPRQGEPRRERLDMILVTGELRISWLWTTLTDAGRNIRLDRTRRTPPPTPLPSHRPGRPDRPPRPKRSAAAQAGAVGLYQSDDT
jgi:hypothetical protein